MTKTKPKTPAAGRSFGKMLHRAKNTVCREGRRLLTRKAASVSVSAQLAAQMAELFVDVKEATHARNAKNTLNRLQTVETRAFLENAALVARELNLSRTLQPGDPKPVVKYSSIISTAAEKAGLVEAMSRVKAALGKVVNARSMPTRNSVHLIKIVEKLQVGANAAMKQQRSGMLLGALRDAAASLEALSGDTDPGQALDRLLRDAPAPLALEWLTMGTLAWAAAYAIFAFFVIDATARNGVQNWPNAMRPGSTSTALGDVLTSVANYLDQSSALRPLLPVLQKIFSLWTTKFEKTGVLGGLAGPQTIRWSVQHLGYEEFVAQTIQALHHSIPLAGAVVYVTKAVLAALPGVPAFMQATLVVGLQVGMLGIPLRVFPGVVSAMNSVTGLVWVVFRWVASRCISRLPGVASMFGVAGGGGATVNKLQDIMQMKAEDVQDHAVKVRRKRLETARLVAAAAAAAAGKRKAKAAYAEKKAAGKSRW